MTIQVAEHAGAFDFVEGVAIGKHFHRLNRVARELILTS